MDQVQLLFCHTYLYILVVCPLGGTVTEEIGPPTNNSAQYKIFQKYSYVQSKYFKIFGLPKNEAPVGSKLSRFKLEIELELGYIAIGP